MPREKPTAADSQNGTYYALAIGINSYRPPLPTLSTAVNDAESVAQLLAERYGFRVQTLLNVNATRANILRGFAQYQSSLGDLDNLLIYYAGHGQQEAEESYWLPADVDESSRANWISADDITHSIKLLKARHILIISDSCYSGGLTREANLNPGRGDDQVLLRRMLAAKSRSLMASGGNEPVSDAGAGGHSVFANAVITALQNEIAEAFTARDLFDGFVQRRVVGGANQTPRYSFIRGSGDESGDFVFVRPGVGLNLAGLRNPNSNSSENVPSPSPSALRPNGLKTKVNPKDGMSYLWIPAGTFKMGCLRGPECDINDGTLHDVTLTKSFWLSQTEVTQAAYKQVVADTPSHFVGANLPVETVTWDEADAYCRKIDGRLPTEAEWEYAARAGSNEARYGFINQIAWFDNNAERRTHDVGQKEPNSWGLYDMLGNVWEWTADFNPGQLGADPVTDPFTSKPRSEFLALRVIRGGSWLNRRSALRASQRNEFRPNSRSSSIGFRCISND
jgi:formylglycine-generating enzyme required for sulfatase activity